MLRTTLTPANLGDPNLASRWQNLAAPGPPFRSWTWVGCLAHERYPDPILAQVHEGTNLIGLALFNRRRHRLGATLHLHESGDPALDSIFTEHNGPVAMPGRHGEVLAAILQAAPRIASRVVLSGLDDAALASARTAGGIIGPLQTRLAPFARLAPGSAYLDTLSRNTRAQIRRSDRAFAAAGPLTVKQAQTVPEALDWLDRLLTLHRATWHARGIESGFAAAPVQRFHRAFLASAVPDGAADLLHVTAGPRTIGYLYNLRGGPAHRNGSVFTYQSGFDYTGDPAEKPGLTCHMAALETARIAGASEYDFLAGDAQYKRSLGNDTRPLHWFTWQPWLSAYAVPALARRVAGR